MRLSIVVPVFNEKQSLAQLVAEVRQSIAPLKVSYELILVDDGSTDGSSVLISELAAGATNIIGVQLRRNFGQSAALQAGIDIARGEIIAFMDADLQNDPADIPSMLEKIDEGFDLVAGWRAERKDRFLDRRLPSMIANKVISFFTSVSLHDYGCTLKLVRSELAKEFRLYGEMHRFIPALASLIGANIFEMKVNHRERVFGNSKYGISRTLRVILDLLTVIFLKSFLVRPMQVFGLTGLVCLSGGLAVTIYLSVQKIFFDLSLSGRPFLLFGALLILVGIQLVSLGLVADVIARTYHEAQNKRPYHVRATFNHAKLNAIETKAAKEQVAQN